MICAALRLLALADPGFAALVSADRFTPEGEGQGKALPRATYLLVDEVPYISHDAAAGLATSRVQVTLRAATESAVAALADALRIALVGKRTYSGGMRIDSIFLVGNHGGYEPDPLVYTRILEFRVTHTEATE